jgi:hypothetical protein
VPEPAPASRRAAWASWLAGRLRDWAERLEEATKPSRGGEPSAPSDARVSGSFARRPPEHWRRLVAERAPQLLDRVDPIPSDREENPDIPDEPWRGSTAESAPLHPDARAGSGHPSRMTGTEAPHDKDRGPRREDARGDAAMASGSGAHRCHAEPAAASRPRPSQTAAVDRPGPQPGGPVRRSASRMPLPTAATPPERPAVALHLEPMARPRPTADARPPRPGPASLFDPGTAATVQATATAPPLRMMRSKAPSLPIMTRSSPPARTPSNPADTAPGPPSREYRTEPVPRDVARATVSPIEPDPEPSALPEVPMPSALPRAYWPTLPDRPAPLAPSSTRRALGSRDWIRRLECEQRGESWNG